MLKLSCGGGRWWWVCRGIFMSNPTYIGLGQARLWLRWGCENTVMMAVSMFTFSVHFHNFVEQKLWFQSFMSLILLQIQQTKNYVLYPIWKTTTQHTVNQEVKRRALDNKQVVLLTINTYKLLNQSVWILFTFPIYLLTKVLCKKPLWLERNTL